MKTAAKDFKMTELGPIPKDWDVKRLGEIGQFKNGISKGAESFGHGVPFVNLLDVFGKDKIDDVRMLGLVEVTAAEQSQCSLKEGDVLFVRSSVKPSGVGLATVVSCDLAQAVFSGFLLRYRSEGLGTEYKRYAFAEQGFRSRVIASSTVSANTNINQGALKNIEVVVPPLPEQRKIAAALSDVDEMIAALEKLIEKKRKIKTGAMQRLLTGNTRLPGFKGVWVEKRLGDFATIARGGSPRPIEAFLTSDSSGVNWIKIGDVGVGAKYIERTEEKIIQEGVNHSRMVGPGDFLLSNSMSFGRPYIMKISGCIHDGWLVIQSYQQSFDTEFLYYVLGSKLVLEQYLTAAAGSSVLNLNKEVVARVIVKCPSSLAEQKAIAKVLGDMDAEIAALEAELAKTRQLKQGMMQELLTGKVRLKG